MSARRAQLTLALTLALVAACGEGVDTGLAPSDAGGSTTPDASEPHDDAGEPDDAGDAGTTAEDAAPVEPADAGSAELSYARDVWPIFELRCQGCHFVTDNPPQILGAAETYPRLVGQRSPTVTSLDWIEPGDPDASYLLRKVEGTHRAVGGRGNGMPPRVADPTTAQERATLRAWITAGAPQN